MRTSEYEQLDGLGIAALLKTQQVTPREVMQCAIDLAQTRGRQLNALCYERYEESLDLADRAAIRGSFGALPFVLKDSALPSIRFPSDVGSRLLKGLKFKFDATLIQRFEAAGFIPFARSTVPEFCMAPTTEAVANGGPTRNPWNLNYSAGGSSGGAAAAVAAGIVPIAHANDGGGSIRIPASCCGLYGLKPSRGLVPMGPARGEGWGGLAAEGVISRSVLDTAAAMEEIAGYEPGAPYAAPSRTGTFVGIASQSFARPLRIASCVTAWDDIAIAPDCVAAVRHTEQVLRSLGHVVEECPAPAIDYREFIEALISLLASNVTATVNGVAKGRPMAEWHDQLEPAYLDAYRLGKSLSAEAYIAAIGTFHSIGRRMEKYLEGYDLWLTPTLAQLPAALGALSSNTDFRTFRQQVARYTPFLAIINASGQPAATVPMFWSSTGLPVGVQLVGHFGRDDLVVQLSAHLEGAAPWAHRRPPLSR
jgi:amidase